MRTLRHTWVRGALIVPAVLAAAVVVRQAASYAPPYLANLRLRWAVAKLDESNLGPRVLVVAPHPDDETLGAGGLIQRSVADGRQVFVVLMTNGDGYQSDRALMVAEEVLKGTAREHLALGRRRRGESLRALTAMGVPADHVISLGYPDGGLHATWQPSYWSLLQPYRSPRTRAERNPYRDSLSPGAPYSGAQVLADLAAVLRKVRPTAIVTTPPFDVQRDHWATYDFVRLAVGQTARETGGETPICCFLIHRHGWPAPQGYHPEQPLKPPAVWARYPGLEWLQLPLSREQVAGKRRRLADYWSQDAARNEELLSFVRSNELFVRLPAALPTTGLATIADPIGDLPPDRALPAEDIVRLRLATDSAPCDVELELADRPDPDLTYVVLWHGLGASAPQSACFIWHHGRGLVRRSQADGRMSEQPVACRTTRRGLSAGIARRFFHDSALLVEGYSRRGATRYLNHTMAAVVASASRLP